MVYVDSDQFNDELQIMKELMDDGQIALSDSSLKKSIESLHLKKAVCIDSGTSMQQCVETMAARQFGCLLVVDNGKLSGIFTERDVLMKIAGSDLNLNDVVIDDFMSKDPAHLTGSDTIESALRMMGKGGYRHIAVVDEAGAPLAVLSIRDIVSYIVEFFPQDVLNLPPHPIRVGTKNPYGG